MMSRPSFPLIWSLLIVFVVVPWYGFQDHAHWGNVAWRPFVDPPWRVLDAFLNVLLYAPLGASLVRGRSRWTAIVCPVGLSVLTEATQLFSHSRVPSMTDVTCNIAGAWVGAALALISRNRGTTSQPA